MAENKRKNKVYSEETKAEAVRLHLEEGLSSYRIADMFEVRSKTQVQQWIKTIWKGQKKISVAKQHGEKRVEQKQSARKRNNCSKNISWLFTSYALAWAIYASE